MEILHLSSSFLSCFVIAFILLHKKQTLASRQFSVIGPTGPIQSSLRGEAELSCYLSPSQSAQHMEVIWFHSTRLVHLYCDGEDEFGDQDPAYQGRTELVRDAITNGNVTLKILDVRFLDAGRYMCLFDDGFYYAEANMELKVLGGEIQTWTNGPLPISLFGFTLFCMEVYLLIMLSFQGFLYGETSLWKEMEFWIPLNLLIITQMMIFFMLLIKYHRQQRHRQSTQPV